MFKREPVALAAHHIVLTEADAGHHLTVHRGTTIEVQLQDQYPLPGSSTRWEARSTDNSVLSRTRSVHQTVTAIANAHFTYTADFGALADGDAQIVVVGNRSCEAMDPSFCTDTSLPSISVTVVS